MGTNYYLKRKINFKPGMKSVLGDFEDAYRVQKLSNGFVWNNKYYKDLTELNSEYFQYIHIGKSSGGWHFALCIYPKAEIKDIYDWKKLFSNKKNIIENEYNDVISEDEMIDIITNRAAIDWDKWTQEAFEQKAVVANNDFVEHYSIGGRKVSTYDELLAENDAVRGIHGLWAHKPDKYTKNSDGTYDYINAELSDFC